MQHLVELLIAAEPAAVQQRMQRLLLTVLGQAAEAARARPRVHAAWLAFLECARQAAAATGLLDQLAAHRHWRAQRPRLLVARLARHVGSGGGAAAHGRRQNQQQRQEQ